MDGGAGRVDSERSADPRRPTVVPSVLALVMVVAGVVLVVGALVVTSFVGQRLWWEPEVAVPRDGSAHRVSVDGGGGAYAIWSDRSLVDPVCALTDADGLEVETAPVPPAQRVALDEPWVAAPEASSTFTAPADGVVVATCEDVDSHPVSELHLAPMHPRLYYDAMQYGVPLLGVLLVCGGIALAIVAAVRRGSRRT